MKRNDMQNDVLRSQGERFLRKLLIITSIFGAMAFFNAELQAQTASTIRPSARPVIDKPSEQVDKGNANKKVSLEQQYNSCSDGYYSGPRPGRVRYTKDTFLWVVTPEFAKRFCMPPEFISEELKGAEAIAFKIYEERDQEVCGWGDRVEVCNKAKEMQFEVYIKSDVKLPKENDVPYYQTATLPSKFLISSTEKDLQKTQEQLKLFPKFGAKRLFQSQQIGLYGVSEGKLVWFVSTMYEQNFFKNLFHGIDHMAFHGMVGMIKDPSIDKKGIKNFVIAFRPLNDKAWSSAPRNLTEFAHVIYLPKDFTDKIRVIDNTPGLGIEDLARRALGKPESSKH